MDSQPPHQSSSHFCTQRFPPTVDFNIPSTNLAPPGLGSGPSSLAMPIGTFWPNGKKLRVKLLPGASTKVQSKVMLYAQLWETYASIDFRFVESGIADIRVSFDPGGSWSYVGSYNNQIPQDLPTMNFGWLTNDTREEEFARVILHEFGHALGCIHEHQSPVANIEWDEDVVYRALMGPPNNWTKEDVDHNIFNKYIIRETRFSPFDLHSIMLYFFPPAWTTNGLGTPSNVVLSPTDKSFINMMYPFQTRDAGTWSTTEQRHWYPPVIRTSKQIDFSSPYLTEPRIAAGLNELDVSKDANIRVKVYSDRVSLQNFVIHADAWADTALYSAGATWLEFDKSESDYQIGEFNTVSVHDWEKPQPKTSETIVFNKAYEKPPNVVVWLKGVDMAKGRNWRVKAYGNKITKTGFDIHIDTCDDSILYSGVATWIAYPTGKEGVISGTENTSAFRNWFPAQQENGGKVTFPVNTFGKGPKIYVAVNELDFDAARNLRFKAFVSDVVEEGFKWHVNSWDDSLCYGAGISWLAFAP